MTVLYFYFPLTRQPLKGERKYETLNLYIEASPAASKVKISYRQNKLVSWGDIYKLLSKYILKYEISLCQKCKTPSLVQQSRAYIPTTSTSETQSWAQHASTTWSHHTLLAVTTCLHLLLIEPQSSTKFSRKYRVKNQQTNTSHRWTFSSFKYTLFKQTLQESMHQKACASIMVQDEGSTLLTPTNKDSSIICKQLSLPLFWNLTPLIWQPEHIKFA